MGKKWILGRSAMIGTLVLGGVWGSIMVLAVLFGREASVIGDMFAGVVAMIVTTLGVLVGGKGWKDYTEYRNGRKGIEADGNDSKISDQ
jgi:hypothetical protein